MYSVSCVIAVSLYARVMNLENCMFVKYGGEGSRRRSICVGCKGDVLLCSTYLIARIIFFTIEVFFSSSLSTSDSVCSPFCFLPFPSVLTCVSDGGGQSALLQKQLRSAFAVKGQGISEWGCHRPSGKKLQGLNNCSISGKESTYFRTAVGRKSTGFVWEAKRSWKWHPGCELVGHKVVELLSEIWEEVGSRDILGRNVISAF